MQELKKKTIATGCELLGMTARRASGRPKHLVFEPLEPRLALSAGALVINEFMAANNDTLLDEDGDSSDWIEIHNPSPAPVNLDGWYLTDDADDLTKWQLPAVTLSPDDYRLVFASGKDRVGVGGELHTDFQLSSDGEYLALVDPDGAVVDAYAPQFPRQLDDISYGLSQLASSFPVTGGESLTYLVPQDGSLGTGWKEAEFDDSAWTGYAHAAGVLITEAGTGSPDYFEIQNVSDSTVDTSGWLAVSNNPKLYDINQVHQPLWTFPGSVAPGELLYRPDSSEDNLLWKTAEDGWVMILDEQGNVIDFVVWGYSSAEVGSMEIDAGGFEDIRVDAAWSGAPVSGQEAAFDALQRVGASDHDNASDWTFAQEPSPDAANDGLTTPFAADIATGIGFDAANSGIGAAVQSDIETDMHGINASVYLRIPFDVADPDLLDELFLQVQYNDGFVAYINGREVARRNAPATPQWNSAATVARSVEDSLSIEQIDISNSLDVLRLGVNVLAIQGLNVTVGDDDFLILPDLSGTAVRYFPDPTPGEPNLTPGMLDYVRDTSFSIDRGFYDAPFDVAVTTPTPNAEIYYTTDGSEPSETNGTLYTGPVHIDVTTVLRVAGLKDDYLPTNVDTQTYVFVDDVITQSEMDRDVIGPGDSFGGVYAATIRDDLRAVPTLSLVMDPDDFSQIYANYNSDIEREVSVEYFEPNSQPPNSEPDNEFQIDAGIELYGADSRNHPKKAFKLNFRSRYGTNELEFPLYEGSPFDRFDQLVLRTSGHDSWATPWGDQALSATYLRDHFMRQTFADMGHVAAKDKFVHVYINGTYWGQYDITERINDEFAADRYGGQKEDYDVIKSDLSGPPYALEGDMNGWNAMMDAVRGGGSADQKFVDLQSHLDMDNFIDVVLLRIWAADVDWIKSLNEPSTGQRNKNWVATYNKNDPDGRFYFHVWDAEICLGKDHAGSRKLWLNLTDLNKPNSPGEIYTALRGSPEFRLRFADRLQRHLFDDGILTQQQNVTRWQQSQDLIAQSIVAESARWGDANRATPYTPNIERQAEIDWIENVFFAQRNDIVLQQFRDIGLFPDLDAPVFGQHGGQVLPGYDLTMIASAAIYYTLDGSDPRLSGGGINPDALVYSGPITLDDNTLVKSRTLSGGEWSALNEAQFITHQPANAENFAITELNYHPYDRTADEIAEGFLDDDDFEFVELKNIGPMPIDLLGVQFTDGIGFDFTGGSVAQLDPGQFVLIVSNIDAFEYRYGSGANVAGQYTGQLANGGEQLLLSDIFGQTIQNFTYGDSNDAGWPNRADGNGSTLEVIDPAGNPSDPDNWRSSGELLGTPGSTGTGSFQSVVVNEVLTHTPDSPLPLGEGLLVDAIELYNSTDTEIPIGGWWLSDDNDDLQKFQIPAGTMIPAYGYVTFYEGHYVGQTLLTNQQNEFGGPGVKDFALSGARGDDVWLLANPGSGGTLRFADHVEFDSANNGESFGRWPDSDGDLYPMTHRTLDGPNSGPRIGPEVLISEVMYYPGEGGEKGVRHLLPERPEGCFAQKVPDPFFAFFEQNLEFIEIFNITSQPIDLTGWRLRKGFDFDFAPGTMVGSRETLVIVAFDPSDVTKLADFRSYYGIGAEVSIVGTFGDRLSNTGEQIQLQRPDTPPANDPLYVPHPLEDQIEYVDTWYAGTNGDGQSLTRAGLNLWGNDAASWAPENPTPGTAAQLDTTVVTGRYVFYNNSSFGATIAPGKTALRPGEQATFANYTSYANGINGIILDVMGLAIPGGIDVNDFTFKLGNDDTPGDWTVAPTPESIDATTSQITLTWNDGTIRNTWLEVTVLATANTGLAVPDVFYFGNAVGETGNCEGETKVDIIDVLLTRQNPQPFFDPATIDNVYDFNRDQRVNAIDTLIARNNQTWSGTELTLLDLTGSKAAVIEKTPELPKTFAQDIIFKRAIEQKADSRQTTDRPLEWLYEADDVQTPGHRSKKISSIEEAVDKLLATLSTAKN